MRRGNLLKRNAPIRVKGHSEVSETKERIQALVREIVIKRDGGCILDGIRGVAQCNSYRKDGQLILQADHLIIAREMGMESIPYCRR